MELLPSICLSSPVNRSLLFIRVTIWACGICRYFSLSSQSWSLEVAWENRNVKSHMPQFWMTPRVIVKHKRNLFFVSSLSFQIWVRMGSKKKYSPSGALIRRECPAISQIISEVDKWWSHHVYLALCLNLFWSLKLYDYIICSFETEFFSFFPPFSYFHFHFFARFPIDINMIKVFSDLCYTTTVNFH